MLYIRSSPRGWNRSTTARRVHNPITPFSTLRFCWTWPFFALRTLLKWPLPLLKPCGKWARWRRDARIWSGSLCSVVCTYATPTRARSQWGEWLPSLLIGSMHKERLISINLIGLLRLVGTNIMFSTTSNWSIQWPVRTCGYMVRKNMSYPTYQKSLPIFWEKLFLHDSKMRRRRMTRCKQRMSLHMMSICTSKLLSLILLTLFVAFLTWCSNRLMGLRIIWAPCRSWFRPWTTSCLNPVMSALLRTLSSIEKDEPQHLLHGDRDLIAPMEFEVSFTYPYKLRFNKQMNK